MLLILLPYNIMIAHKNINDSEIQEDTTMMKSFEPGKMAKQMIEFQKTAFENSFSAMVMIQGQTEKIADQFLTKNSIIPEEGQKMINEWRLSFKKGRDDFKKSVDENFKRMESFFEDAAEIVKPKASK
jgi:polyhydroxyalkanoate synthesis regulator phasin